MFDHHLPPDVYLLQIKNEQTIWQNYRPFKKPEPTTVDPHASGPYFEKLAMAFMGFMLLGTLAGDMFNLILQALGSPLF